MAGGSGVLAKIGGIMNSANYKNISAHNLAALHWKILVHMHTSPRMHPDSYYSWSLFSVHRPIDNRNAFFCNEQNLWLIQGYDLINIILLK